MTAYNWANLSDHDFEAVCRDVMAETLGVPVEVFATGADGGIDLRATKNSSLVIGQAKHYVRSTYSKLLTSMGKEKVKLDKMTTRPRRYILYTSMALSPQRKQELRDTMAPYIRRTSDIIGLEELEGFLRDHEKIEAGHYKLWLASAKVLNRILGNAALTRSEVRIEELIEKSRLYVPHEKLSKAEEILAKEHCLIVSGAPGIGKTTMAEMLALRFLEAGFQCFFVKSVDELEAQLRPDEKQAFVYDDFLGRTNFREAPDAPSQERLFSLMRYIAKKPNKHFILTTREYLYKEAHAANDRLAESRADLVRCLLDVSGYPRETRAQILYNHLYWTPGIPMDALAEFVRSGGHWEIIRHENFNPRWIADALNRLAEPKEGEGELPWT